MWYFYFGQARWRNWTFGVRWIPNKFFRFIAIDLGPWSLIWEYGLPEKEEEK